MKRIKRCGIAAFTSFILFLFTLFVIPMNSAWAEIPVADAGPDQTAIEGQPVTLDGSGSSISKGKITDWDWNFGDGSSGSGEIVSHTYQLTGTYTVTLTVSTKKGDTDSDTAVITVEANGGGGNEPDPGSKPSGMKVYVTGNAGWVTTAHEEGYVYMGGSTESDDAMAWFNNKSNGGDVVIIRASGSDGYNDYLYTEIGGIDSVHSMVITKTSQANSSYVETVIKNAEALWIAGGDQTAYYDIWNDTKVESAIHYLINTKKAVVGGTSAGMAVLADVDYIPESSGVLSSEALANPYHSYITLMEDFVWGIPNVYGIITDTHFSERDRLGRTITFMARTIQDGLRTVSETRNIACDERAAVCIDNNGQARIFGFQGSNDYVYFFSADTAPDTCQAGFPLHWLDAVTVYKVRGLPSGANTFNLVNWTGTGGSWHSVDVNNGSVTNDIQEPN